MGYSSLDPVSGRVTSLETTEPIPDSYFFVSDADKKALIEHEQSITARYSDLARSAALLWVGRLRAVDKIMAYASGDLTTQEIEQEVNVLVDQSGFELDLTEQMMRAKVLACDVGYLSLFLTPQEILLNMYSRLPEDHKRLPHTPVGIQLGVVSLVEAKNARTAEKWAGFSHNDSHFGYDRDIKFTLEPLDQNGQTQKSPAILNPYSLEPLSHMNDSSVI